MEEVEVIELSRCEWASPIVLVPKKDRTTTFCVDYRWLNEVSRFDAYPMPRVDDIIDRLGCNKYVTTLDLSTGYWQVPHFEASKERSAFVTPFGLYQFKTMPFGLHGAPATFQRMMNGLSRGTESFSSVLG